MELGDGIDNWEVVGFDHSTNNYGSYKGRSTDRSTNGKVQVESFRRKAIKLFCVR